MRATATNSPKTDSVRGVDDAGSYAYRFSEGRDAEGCKQMEYPNIGASCGIVYQDVLENRAKTDEPRHHRNTAQERRRPS